MIVIVGNYNFTSLFYSPRLLDKNAIRQISNRFSHRIIRTLCSRQPLASFSEILSREGIH